MMASRCLSFHSGPLLEPNCHPRQHAVSPSLLMSVRNHPSSSMYNFSSKSTRIVCDCWATRINQLSHRLLSTNNDTPSGRSTPFISFFSPSRAFLIHLILFQIPQQKIMNIGRRNSQRINSSKYILSDIIQFASPLHYLCCSN